MQAISVVLPVYNSVKYISETLMSVLNQTLAPDEIIVVDDNSNDRTESEVRALMGIHKNIKLISLIDNSGGPATPRNIGVEAAKGDFVAFIDSDDVWHPQKLEMQHALIKDKNLDFVSSKSWKLQSGKSPAETARLKKKLPTIINTTKVTRKDFICKNPLCASSVFVRKEIIQKIRFDSRRDYVAIEDYVAWRKIHDSVIDFSLRIDFPLVDYRVHGNSISFSKFKMAARTFNYLRDYHANSNRVKSRVMLEFFGYAIYGALKRCARQIQNEWH
jgi:teichuronic acid biosynthesis glycosyltransferase TuaG